MRKYLFFALISFLLLQSCKNTSNLNESGAVQQIFLDTFLVPLAPPPYQASESRTWDMLHMNLELEPDWELSQIIGRSKIYLKPYFYPTDSLIIDAKGFLLHKLKAYHKNEDVLEGYKYDGNKISFYFKKHLSREDSLILDISYTARPDSMNDNASGRAIASEKGLFFINPDGMKTSKPRQLWTQGETEYNSRWFPCIDNPNERLTHQISITVEEGLSTLSNGELMFSTMNGDSSRTDVWEMNRSHAPYLVMLAVGDFIQVKDSSSEIPMSYWVEPDFGKEATNIFGRTPDMMTFYDSITGVKYPWNKFDQIIVRDYISGAMENTSAVIHGEFLYHKEKELLDTDEEDIIAHELFHHWFGNLVTCESWANLTLNEGFASYGEYLWRDYSKGKDWGQSVLMNFKQSYKEEARFTNKQLIRYNYRDENEMFDRHSYDKGALVLHMLRDYLGDEAFFKGMQVYLEKNAFSSVEVHDLRLAFEEVSGLDLNWFFNQWYLSKGYPELEIAYAVKENSAQIMIVQKQDLDKFGVFQLPIKVLVQSSNKPEIHEFFVKDEVSIFKVPADSSLQYISFDPEEALLVKKQQDRSVEWVQKELLGSNNIETIWTNWVELLDKSYEVSVPLNNILEYILEHPSQHLRKLCVEWLDREIITSYNLTPLVRKTAKGDSASVVRNEALLQLLNLSYPEKKADFIAACKDHSVLVSSTAIAGLSRFAINEALICAKEIESSEYDDHLLALAELYANEASEDRIYFFKEAYEKMNSFRSPQLISFLSDYMQKTSSVNAKVEGLTLVQDYMLNQTVWWQKIVGIDALNALKVQQENIIRKLSASAAKNQIPEEKQVEFIQQIMNADLVLENINAVRELVLATESNPKIKELMR